jgi:hypothetical protein
MGEESNGCGEHTRLGPKPARYELDRPLPKHWPFRLKIKKLKFEMQ